MLSLPELILRFGLSFLLVIALDWYVFQSIRVVAKKALVRYVYWTVNISYLLVLLLIFLTAGISQGPNSPMLRTAFGGFILLLAPKIMIAIFLLLEDIYRIAYAVQKYVKSKLNKIYAPPQITNSISLEAHVETLWMPRREFISKTGIFVASLPFLGVAHGLTFGAYNYQVHRIIIRSRYLPDAFNGFRLVQISDIHAGSLSDKEAVARGIDLILAQEADLIVFTGDLVNNFTKEIEKIFDLLSRLRSPNGVFSILGNHDYGLYARYSSKEALLKEQGEMQAAHKALGWHLLKNQNYFLHKEGQKIAILGVENWGRPPFPQYGDLKVTLEGVEEQCFKILLSHDPTHWDAQVLRCKQRIDLTLSGHTHGMQFGVEIGNFKWSPVSLRYPRWAGLYQEGEKYLYVNRGFGFIGFPGRIGIFPEITVITLSRA